MEACKMKKMMIALLLAAGAMVFTVGCEKKPEEGAKAGGDSVGVAECDDYLKKMDACFAKDPATKTAMEGSLKQSRDAWKAAAASGGAAKDALKTSCKTMVDAIPANCK
jgi:hypothetical protein